MFEFLALITNEKYWFLHSWIVKQIMQIYGVKVGKRFYIEGLPKLKIMGKAKDIVIGDNVSIYGKIDLRNRENGKIVIEDNVAIDDNCRFVSANDAILKIGKGSAFGNNCVFNCGESVSIGEKCLFAGMVYLNSSDHNFVKDNFIRDQGYSHNPIMIEDDVWVGGHVSINKGVAIKRGSIIGANAVVTKSTEEFSINVGIPAKKIAERQ